jgi:hypothetical protein
MSENRVLKKICGFKRKKERKKERNRRMEKIT